MSADHRISQNALTSVGGKGCSSVVACLAGDSGVDVACYEALWTATHRHLPRSEEIPQTWRQQFSA